MARQQQQLHQHGGVSLFHNPLSTKLTGKQSCCLKFSEAKNAECNECELVKSPLWDPTTRSLDTAKTLNSKPRENPTSRSRPRQTSRHRQNPNPWEEPCRMHGILSHPLRRAHGTAVGFITPRKEHWNPSAKDPARLSLFVTYTPFGFGGVGSNSNSGGLEAEERWQSTSRTHQMIPCFNACTSPPLHPNRASAESRIQQAVFGLSVRPAAPCGMMMHPVHTVLHPGYKPAYPFRGAEVRPDEDSLAYSASSDGVCPDTGLAVDGIISNCDVSSF